MDYNKKIDAITIQFQEMFSEVSYETLNKKPNEKQWSISQNIEHLMKVNQSYFPIFKTIEKGKLSIPLIGNFRFYANYIGRTILKSVNPNNSKKIKTSTTWRPIKADGDKQILDNFVLHQETLKNHIAKMEKWIKRNIVIYSPVSKALVYTLPTALEIIITHEERHLNQAKKVLDTIVKREASN